MKKCAEFLLFFFAAVFFLCCKGTDKSKTIAEEKDITITPFEFHETFKLNEHAIESPTIKFDMSLSLVETGDAKATDNINQVIAYTLFEHHSSSVKEACEEFVTQRRNEYMELLPEYINSKENSMPAVWFYNYYNANSEVKKGYKGYINYIITWEEFTGGAHPNSYYTVLNFNPKTGEEIVLEDILINEYGERLTELLIANLARQLNVADINGIKGKGYLYEDAEMFISNNFILGNDKIVFIYNRYDIAPYALGDIMIDVTYDELKDLMK